MRRTLSRRTLFFIAMALIVVALVPAAPPEFRWVVWATFGLAAFWAVLLAAEDVLGPRHEPADRARTDVPNPFEPPPPPRLRWPGSDG